MESRLSDAEVARPASQPNHRVTTLHDVRIPLSDGLELSANLWLPDVRDDASDERFPAILELIPYRKDDWRAASDQARGEWLAARGYALCRLEMTVRDDDPAHARMHNEVVYRLNDGGADVRMEASGTTRGTETDFHVDVGLRVTLDGALFSSAAGSRPSLDGSCE
jgi:hypothetical protein